MKKILVGAFPFFCMILMITFISREKPIQNLREYTVTVQHGLLTLPVHNDQDVFNIRGQWYFTPNQFYYFKDNTRPLYAPLPGRLSETALKTDFGYASYGLRIVGLNPNKVYALQLSHILSSCTIVINGIDRAGQGQPGVSARTEIPGKTISIATFKPLKNGTADIIINISNFHNRYGGTDQSIILGSAEMLNRSFVFNLLFYNIASTVLLLFSIFFIILHLNYKKIPYILWFAFAAITISIRISVFYPHILAYIWPAIPWKLYFILRYSSMPLAALFFTIFINKILNIRYTSVYRSIIVICLLSTTLLFPENSDTAVLCGIEIQKKLQEKCIQLKNLQSIKIRAGIGIDTGRILLGVIGNDSRLDSVVISNTCYTAEELQAATKIYSNTIIISESIFRSLKRPEDFHIRCIQESPIIGEAEQSVLYEVYDCDMPDIQNKKRQTASRIEKALKSIKERDYARAQTYLTQSLEIFSDDPLALYYQRLIIGMLSDNS